MERHKKSDDQRIKMFFFLSLIFDGNAFSTNLCLRCGGLGQATRLREAKKLQDEWASSFREVSVT